MTYKYQSVESTGSAWTRCASVSIDNRINSTPSATFVENRVCEVAGTSVESFKGSFTVGFDPLQDIQLRDPETGLLTGETAPQAYLYQLLYSLYMQKALERDAG